MIKDFRSRFGFNQTPFTCEIRPKDRFNHEVFEKSLGFLCNSVEKRMSASLIAPAGTGKTTLLRTLKGKLPETRYHVHYVNVTDLSKRDFCREIAVAVGCESAGTYPSLVRKLQRHFTETIDNGGVRSVIILDEAHDIRPDVMGLVRILTNFEMDSRLVVSIVLSGQPPLIERLKSPRLEDVARRLSHNATLRPFSKSEIIEYIKHRCHISGSRSDLFDQDAFEAIYEIGRGNLRATDHLTLKSLETAHGENSNVVDSKHVVAARRLLWP